LDNTIQRGPASGLRFRGGKAGYLLGASEPAVQEALVQYLGPGDVLYDVGANVGYMSVLGARLVGPRGRVECFEPLPSNVELLRENLDTNKFTNFAIHEFAASDHDGQARMSLGDGLRIGNGQIVETADHTTIEVPIHRLDGLKLRPPQLVKIDVEGVELAVLRGMTNILEASRPKIIVELHGVDDDEVERFLRAAGYEPRQLDDGGGMRHLLAVPAS
jgi:FkbM family methyltransferase